MPVVSLYANLRKIAGVKEIQLEERRLSSLLQAVTGQFPGLREALLDGQRLRPHIIITINGQNVDPEGGLDLPLLPGDHIAIFPPIAGG